MFIRQPLSIGNLLLDTSNYRIGKQENQKAARDAIIAEQGKKLITLAKDIIENGLNPFDLPLVIDADDGHSNFIVIEGNRRLTAIILMLKPDLAEGTVLHTPFKKLNKDHADSIPKVFDCMIAPNKKSGLVWINRKHQSGLEGAGTEPWTAMAKARADQEQGILRPDLDAVNFVLANSALDPTLRATLTGSDFNITSLKRLIETKGVQQAAGFAIQNGKLVSDQDKDRMQGIMTDVAKIIATGKKDNGEKFTERNIDSIEKREEFIEEVLEKHPKKKKAAEAWEISGTPVGAKKKALTVKPKSTPSTDDQQNLIPRRFKLELPSGKVNDVFIELKELDVTKKRHAVSVLFRVFVEFSLDDYIKKHGITLPLDKNGHVKDSLPVRLEHVKAHVKANKLLNEKELKPINVALADKASLISPDTLNAYVHSLWMNPDPLALKVSWGSLQLFLERLWTSKK